MNMKIDDMSIETIKKYLEQREKTDNNNWIGKTVNGKHFLIDIIINAIITKIENKIVYYKQGEKTDWFHITYLNEKYLDIVEKDWRDVIIEKYEVGDALEKITDASSNKCLRFKTNADISYGESDFWKKVFRFQICIWKKSGEDIRFSKHSYVSYEEFLKVWENED